MFLERYTAVDYPLQGDICTASFRFLSQKMKDDGALLNVV
jgi:hypothetical protein